MKHDRTVENLDGMPVYRANVTGPFHDPSGAAYQLSFYCPHCRRLHFHGGGAEFQAGAAVHRAAHCHDDKRGRGQDKHPNGYWLKMRPSAAP